MAGKQRVVGLTIGTANIIAVQGLVEDAAQGRRTAIVEKVATVKTPQGAVRSNGVHNPDAVVRAVKELWRANGLQTKNVVLGIDSRRIQSGVKWVNYASPKSLRELMEGNRYVNDEQIVETKIDPKSSIHHFVLRERSISDPSTQTKKRQILLMVIEVPGDESQAMANIVEDAGLELVGMDLTGLGMMRATSLSARDDKRVVDMVVDIGDTFVTMLLHNNGNIRAVDTIAGSAGSEVTKGIGDEIRRLSKTVPNAGSADPAKIKEALPQFARKNPDDPITQRALAVVSRYASTLAQELDQFVGSYLESVNESNDDGDSFEMNGLPQRAAHTEERGLASITLTGGGSALHGLQQRLSDPEEGFAIQINHAAVATAYIGADGNPVPPFVNGVSIVSTVGLLTADRKGV